MTESSTRVEGLAPFSRHITTHDSTGLAIFHTPDPAHPENSTSTPGPPISTEPTWVNFPGSGFGLCYATDTTPADFNADDDIDSYYDYLHRHPGISIQGGSVLRVVDMQPGSASPMHRTVSLDYGVVLEGEVELHLDSGEKRRLSRGDIFVQRGTAHQWKNPSETDPARLLLVHLGSKEVMIENKGALPESMSL